MSMIENKISKFLKDSVALIDDVDIAREMNEVQLKYAADLLQKEIEIQNLEDNIKKINSNTEKIVTDNEQYRAQFQAIQDQLS